MLLVATQVLLALLVARVQVSLVLLMLPVAVAFVMLQMLLLLVGVAAVTMVSCVRGRGVPGWECEGEACADVRAPYIRAAHTDTHTHGRIVMPRTLKICDKQVW